MNAKLSVCVYAFVLLCWTGVSASTILSVPTVIQEQNQWCWAAGWTRR